MLFRCNRLVMAVEFLRQRWSAGFVLPNHVRGNKNDQLLLHLGTEDAGEKLAKARDVAQYGDFPVVSGTLGLDEAAQDDRRAVTHANQRRGLLGVQNGSRGGSAGGRFGGDPAGSTDPTFSPT